MVTIIFESRIDREGLWKNVRRERSFWFRRTPEILVNGLKNGIELLSST